MARAPLVEERAHRPLPRDAIGLAINSISGRRRTSCTSISTACGSMSSRRCANTLRRSARTGRNSRCRWSGHDYMAMRIDQPELGHINPFVLLADGMPARAPTWAHYTLVVVGADRTGFVLLAGHATPATRRLGLRRAASGSCVRRGDRRGALTSETIMQLGFNLPISGPTSSARSFTRIAQEGEAMGYDYLTLTDHVVLPDMSVPGYPYSESGEFMSNAPTERHEHAHRHGLHRREDLAHPAGARRHGGAASAGGACGEDAVHDRRAVRGAAGRRHRRRLAEGGVRCRRDHAVRRTRRGDRRIPGGVPRAVDRGARAVRRTLREVRRPDLPAAAGAAAVSADLGRRRERSVAASRRAVRRCVVSDRLQQQGICSTRCRG